MSGARKGSLRFILENMPLGNSYIQPVLKTYAKTMQQVFIVIRRTPSLKDCKFSTQRAALVIQEHSKPYSIKDCIIITRTA
jgi:hypothetical protein